MEEIKSRIIDLEINYTHQINLIEELNMELTSANTRIDQLERKVKALNEMVGSLGPELIQSPDE